MAAKHHQLTDEVQENASLFAAGALPQRERLEYLRHIDEDNCNVCLKEALEFEAVAGLLALVAPLEAPSSRVRDRLMAGARTAT